MGYQTVFEFTMQPVQWPLIVSSVILVIIGVICTTIWMVKEEDLDALAKIKDFIFIAGVAQIFFAIFLALLFTVDFVDNRHIKNALRDRTFLVVEGKIEDFAPANQSRGGTTVEFTVHDEKFSFTGHPDKMGINVTSNTGIVIKRGVDVRIAYLRPLVTSTGNVMLKMEVKQ